MIREYSYTLPLMPNAHIVRRSRMGGGVFVSQRDNTGIDNDPLFVCDTAEEAESVRKLLEAECEEIEAVRRRYEQQLTAMVHHG